MEFLILTLVFAVTATSYSNAYPHANKVELRGAAVAGIPEPSRTTARIPRPTTRPTSNYPITTGDHLPVAPPISEQVVISLLADLRAPIIEAAKFDNDAAEAFAIISSRSGEEPAAIVDSNSEVNEDGSYKFSFETADGVKVQQAGEQTQIGEEMGAVSKGSYSYTSPDGTVITVNWVADENGFQATGDHLPTPPPMPEHVRRHTKPKQEAFRSASELNDDGSFSWNFASEDGINLSAAGNQKQVGPNPEEVGTVARGSYSYSAPDGTPVALSWISDENGFQAKGDHLPTPPPLPPMADQVRRQIELKPVAILRSASDFKEDGSFSWNFASEDGTNVNAAGSQKKVGPEPEDIGTVSKGSYSYVDPDGVTITVSWVADENGFQAKGDHLPVAPPMPKHARRQIFATQLPVDAAAARTTKLNRVFAEPVASSRSELNPDGSYNFSFESEGGTKVEESGSQKKVGPEPEDVGTVSRGSYSFVNPDGVTLTVNWVADENGFQATGDHLPTPPPMPEHARRQISATQLAATAAAKLYRVGERGGSYGFAFENDNGSRGPRGAQKQ